MTTVATLVSTAFLLGLLLALKTAFQYGVGLILGLDAVALKIGIGPAILKVPHLSGEHRLGLLPFGIRASDPTQLLLPRWSIVMVAGPAICWFMAISVWTISFYRTKVPVDEAIVGEVTPGSPAAGAGFRPGDKVTAINGRAIGTFDEMRTLVAASASEPLRVSVERAGQPLPLIEVRPKEGKIGVMVAWSEMSFARAVKVAASLSVTAPMAIGWAVIAPAPDQPPMFATAGELRRKTPDKSPAMQWRLLLQGVGTWTDVLAFVLLLPVPWTDGWQILQLLRRHRKADQAEMAATSQ